MDAVIGTLYIVGFTTVTFLASVYLMKRRLVK
jgi:hypothetical protein